MPSLPPDLIQSIYPNDLMFAGNVEHYFASGRSAAELIGSIIQNTRIDTPKRILDFGSGAGRVTRWLPIFFPDAEIHACDVRQSDIEFVRETLALKAWVVSPKPAQLDFGATYDLIWAGSVVTHLTEAASESLISKLIAACTGILLLSSHGRYVLERPDKHWYPLTDDDWAAIRAGYETRAYGYADYPGQQSYGISVIAPEWFSRERPYCRTVMYRERAWDNHHDVVALSAASLPGL